ncbi:hypothetical protein BZ13_855 [Francisella philomiragia subsp. philomiragia ATCC 25015]|uniref:hypothetical protein n=1 Tax=Francisella philomiragia TaxID=28110 RepID=UPI0001AF77B5|nr:hypothetical protein [Francisella philomiragia]AJI75827.1 hypothetical protein BZ13_855 [Francisella philomiragia subsp. philomiragia ATCC 25015]EET20923.1 predicted protein [Francisella philomiragia subsp. philomiragia ATCC 25015]MBK2238187.1 hypothetical protein [Francisella philomiragia]
MIDVKREMYIDNNKLHVKTTEIEGFRYGFYLIIDDQVIERNNYSKESNASFEFAPFYGSYKIQFFYKNSAGEEFSFIEDFSIVEKAGHKTVVMNKVNNFFLDANNKPIAKRLFKNILVQEKILKKEAKKLDDSYPGQKFNIVIMTLPTSDVLTDRYLFFGIDNFSKELYTGSYPSNNYIFVNKFVEMLRVECPYTIDQVIIDDNIQVKGLSKLAKSCKSCDIKYDLVSMEQLINNSKSLSKINELIELLYKNINIESRQDFVDQMISLTNNYNFFEKNIEVGDMTPYQKLEKHFGKV